MKSMLKVSELHQAYGGSHILRGLSFEAQAGEITVILGRNGVGKTTLLKSLMGVVPTKSGTIMFDGADITRAAPYERARRGIGYVPQGREIFGRLTVEENLAMSLAGHKIPRQMFELFPVLKQMLSRRGGDLSGGQQQQLAIARALCAAPKLLILDEPTEGIQPSVIKDIGRVLQRLAHEGLQVGDKTQKLAVILVEQYYDFAEELADQYLVMERGSFVAQGRGEHMQRDAVRERISV